MTGHPELEDNFFTSLSPLATIQTVKAKSDRITHHEGQ